MGLRPRIRLLDTLAAGAGCAARGPNALVLIEPVHVAAHVEGLQRRYAVPTVKEHLSAVRMLFDWLGAIVKSW